VAFFQREEMRVVAARAQADGAVQTTVFGVAHAGAGLVGVPEQRELEVVLGGGGPVAGPVSIFLRIGRGRTEERRGKRVRVRDEVRNLESCLITGIYKKPFIISAYLLDP